VFPSNGKTGHLTTIKRSIAKAAKEAKLIDVRPNDLRKAFTPRILAAGTDLRSVMSLTGHTQVAVLLKHYGL
jgi:site-specific recombinase XerD